MRIVGLCSGIGGFELAATWVGWPVVGMCEIDPWCRRVLNRHWPGVPIHDDLWTLTPDIVRGWLAADPGHGEPQEPEGFGREGAAQGAWPGSPARILSGAGASGGIDAGDHPARVRGSGTAAERSEVLADPDREPERRPPQQADPSGTGGTARLVPHLGGDRRDQRHPEPIVADPRGQAGDQRPRLREDVPPELRGGRPDHGSRQGAAGPLADPPELGPPPRTPGAAGPPERRRQQEPLGRGRQGRQPWLLTGGIPCQPFSAAGKQQGVHDPRHLWPAVSSLLRGLDTDRPDWLVVENVSGFVKLALDDLLLDLDDLGYAAQPVVVPAAGVGALHKRDRVWVVAHRADLGPDQGRPLDDPDR